MQEKPIISEMPSSAVSASVKLT